MRAVFDALLRSRLHSKAVGRRLQQDLYGDGHAGVVRTPCMGQRAWVRIPSVSEPTPWNGLCTRA